MNTETTPCPRVPCSTDECENLTSGYSIGSLRPLCDSCIAKREEEEDEETPRQRRSAERWDRDMQAYKERGL